MEKNERDRKVQDDKLSFLANEDVLTFLWLCEVRKYDILERDDWADESKYV